MKTKDGIIKLAKADFVMIGGTANVGAFTNDDGGFAERKRASGHAPTYTSEKILIERIETTTQVYEIHPEQLEQFIECDSDRLEICFGKPCDEHYAEKRRVL